MTAKSNISNGKYQNESYQQLDKKLDTAPNKASAAKTGIKGWVESYKQNLNSPDKNVRNKTIVKILLWIFIGLPIIGELILCTMYFLVKPILSKSNSTQTTTQTTPDKPKVEYNVAADNEEYEFTCTKLVEGSTSNYVYCETDGMVTGTYEPAEKQNLQPQYVTAENGKWSFSAKSVSITRSDIAPKSGLTDDKVPHSKQETVKVRMNAGGKDVASVNVKINFNFTDEVYAELLATNRQNAIEYAAAAPERARQQHISDLKACRIATNDWTDAEAGEYADDYVKCRQQEYDREKSTWESTAPSKVDTRSLCRTAGEAAAPYGIKFHNVVGVLSEEVQSAHERLYKVQVDVTNAFGATRETVMECKVSNGSGTNKVTYLNIY